MKNKTQIRIVVALMGVIVSAGIARAGSVSIKNGNYFAGFTDLQYSGGIDPKIERVYNSKTPFRGIFGWGWGSELEPFLSESPDGSVVLHEYGGGAENRFNPAAFSKSELEKAVNDISQGAAKAGLVGTSGATFEQYKKRLWVDATFRNDEWQKLRVNPRVQLPYRQLKEGAQLQSNKFSFQYITRVKDGYVRVFDSGKVEKYGLADRSGRARLIQVSDKNGNFIQLNYADDGRLQKMVDNFNRKILIEMNNRGLVTAIKGENDKVARYSYNDRDQLTQSVDVEGNQYQYKYDPRHNLTEIAYKDGSIQQMTYYDQKLFENVKSLKDRDGTLTEYSYDYRNGGRDYRKIGIRVKDSSGKPVSNSSYEYHLKYKANGEEWTYKLVSDVDEEKTETIYNECCGLPLVIKRGGQETAFEYDSKGHVTKKVTPTEVTQLSYHAQLGKVTKVNRVSRANKKDTAWSEFTYDNRGNLVFAKNSDRKAVKLFYDKNGRIQSMVDQDRRRIDFKYNENSKPIEIRDPKLGAIKVTYTNSGEIKKVESSAGRKIALQVTSAFQNLLDIISPAGVNLSF